MCKTDCDTCSGICDKSNTHKTEYLKGSASGFHASDSVTFGNNLTAQKQSILVIDYFEDMSGIGGICGMGFKALSDGYATMLDNLQAQNVIKNRKFSFYLSEADREGKEQLSELIIGGYDEKYIEGDNKQFVFADILKNNTFQYDYWAVAMDKITVGTENINFYENTNLPLRTVIDSGTSLAVFNSSIHDKFVKAINDYSNMDCEFLPLL